MKSQGRPRWISIKTALINRMNCLRSAVHNPLPQMNYDEPIDICRLHSGERQDPIS